MKWKKNFQLIIQFVILFLLFITVFSTVNPILLKGQQTTIIETQQVIDVFATDLDFSTFFGKSNYDHGYDIAAFSDGCSYITGTTDSVDFPILNAYNSTFGGTSDAFIAKFSSSGDLLWSTFLGGNLTDEAYNIVVASDGSCFVTGRTDSNNFPTKNAYDNSFNGYRDSFIAKFSTTGDLLWSTYLGGGDIDFSEGIALTSDGSCIVTGQTGSYNFPTLNAIDDSLTGGIDCFITKFSSNGSLIWSTFLGGSDWDWSYCITTTNDDGCFVSGCTYSNNFPTVNAYSEDLNGVYDTFVVKLSSSGVIEWSTYLGGSSYENGLGIATNPNGDCYLTGYTTSSDFPTYNAYDSTHNGGTNDAFITKFSDNGTLKWSTFLGGDDYDRGFDIVATNNCCYLTGYTQSTNFPILNATDSTHGGGDDVFLAKFSSNCSLLWSTFMGGDLFEQGYGLDLTNDNTLYLTGYTSSSNFPTKNAYDISFNGDGDVFISKVIDLAFIPPPNTNTETISPSLFISIPCSFAFILILPIFLLRRKRG